MFNNSIEFSIFMIIAGIQKTSLVDWPEKICATVFIAGCNFRCSFCHNPDLVFPEEIEKIEPLSEMEVLTIISDRQKYIDGVCITGGEPLLSPDVVKLIRKIKAKGLLVKVDTNGSNPKVLRSLINEKLIDYVAMDIKGPKDKYSMMCCVKPDFVKIEETISILKESNINYEFRTTVVKGLLDPEDIISTADWLRGGKAYYLQNFVSDTKLIDPGLKDQKTYTPSQLQEMLSAVAHRFEKTGVRGV
jgi:pyruvate formate lyase activating enzyme